LDAGELGDHSKRSRVIISVEANDEEDEDPHKRPEGKSLQKRGRKEVHREDPRKNFVIWLIPRKHWKPRGERRRRQGRPSSRPWRRRSGRRRWPPKRGKPLPRIRGLHLRRRGLQKRKRLMSVLSYSWTKETWMPHLGNIGSSLVQRSFKDVLVVVMELVEEEEVVIDLDEEEVVVMVEMQVMVVVMVLA
jgi:hypothetical protein